jgi:hypothetical protein
MKFIFLKQISFSALYVRTLYPNDVDTIIEHVNAATKINLAVYINR